MVKHVAQCAAVDDMENLSLIISAGLFIFLTIGLVGFILFYGLAGWLAASVFNIAPELHGAAVIAIQLSGVGFFFMMLISLLEGVAMGINRFDIPNLTRIVNMSISAVLMVVGVLTGYGLIGVVAGYTIGTVSASVVSIVLTFRLVPRPRIRGATQKVRDLFSFGKFVIVSQGIGTLAGQVGSTALGILSSMANLTYYAIPTKIITVGMDVFRRLSLQLFPISAALDSQQEKERLRRIFVELTRWQLVLFTPLLILALFHGRWLLRFWLGPEFVTAGYTILLITVVYQIISALTAVPTQYAMGMGHPEYTAWFSAIRLVLILACIYPFIKLHGPVGVAEATFISSLQGLAFIILVSRKLLKLNLWHLLRKALLKLAGLLGCFIILYVLLGNRIDSNNSIIAQAGVGLVLLALYFFLAVVIRVFPIEEGKRLLKREFWKKL